MRSIKSVFSFLCLYLFSLGINAQSSDIMIDQKTIVRFNETYYNLECHLEIPEDKKLQEYLSELIFCKKNSDLRTAYEAFLKKYERANSVQTTRGTIIVNFTKEYELTGRFSCYHLNVSMPGMGKYIQLLLSSKDDKLGEQYTKFLTGTDREFIFDMQKHELLGIDQIFVPAIAEKLKSAFGNNPSLYAEDRCLCIFSKKSEGKFLFNETTEKHFTDYFKQLVGWGQQKNMDTPRFLRGESALKKFYADNKITVASDDDPEADTIIVSVVVSEDGSPVRTAIKKTTKYLPSNKLHEINEKMPKWLPAYQDGKAITKEVTFSLGIHPNRAFAEIENPTYPGGMDALQQFLSSNIKYPVEAEEKGITGRVLCSFIVESDGSIANVKIAKSDNPLLDNEAIRVLSSMPKWNPGKKNGKPVRAAYTLPVTFQLGVKNTTIAYKNNTIAYEGINYRLSGKEAKVIYGKDKYTGSISIPKAITHQGVTYSVTEIGSSAFHNCSGLTSVSIPKSVTTIGENAFNGCSGLTSVIIPNSITSIGSRTFGRCSGLTSVTIPQSVTSIGMAAFAGCSGLTSISVENGNTKYDSRENCNAIIETETNTLVTGCKNTIIPNSVTSIGARAFSSCAGLTAVTIPGSVTKIGGWAFDGCSDLTAVKILGNVTEIGGWTFRGCSGLKSVVIPNSVTSIGISAFEDCSGLTEVTIPGSVTSIGDDAFSGCSGLKSVTIPKSVTSIGYNAFHVCSGLTSITVESGNTKYDSRNNCNAIIETSSNTLTQGCKNTIIPNSVTSIGYKAFSACSGLKSVIIPNSVTTIGGWAFFCCSGLTSVKIPNSVTSIGFAAFWGCSGLTSVTIPKSVTSIGDRAFWDCSNLKSFSVESGNPKYNSRDKGNAIVETATKTIIASCDKAEEDTIIKKVNLQPSVVFMLGKTSIERSQEANVEMVAKYVNKNKDCKILVQGFANDWDVGAKSKKEWEAIQYMLSKRRADNVKKMLVKKYSIDADKIIAKGCGFTDKLFDEIEFNRVVLFHDISK